MPVTAELVPSVLTVESGGSATVVVQLANAGSTAETVQVRVQGDAARYAWVSSDSIPLGPGERREVKVGFRLPKIAAIAAGRMPFSVTDGDEGPVLAEGALEVLPYVALSARLDPPEASGPSSRHRLTVSTRGNAAVEVTLSVDADEGLKARLDPPVVEVGPERPAEATVEVDGTRRTIAGSPVQRSFTVVASPRGGAPVQVRGTLVHEPLLPGRTAALAIVLAVVLALVAGGLTLRLVSSARSPGASVPSAAETIPSAGPVDARTRCPAEFHHDPIGIRSLTPEDIKRLPDDYSFLRIKEDKCSPIRFNPCQPVPYVQNPAVAPPGVVEDVREAFRRLGEATGITFVDEGFTDETERAGPYVPERYGQRWAPILVLWQHFGPERTEGEVQILGNTNVMRVEDTVVSGRLRFNVDAYNDEQTRAPIEPGFGPPGPATNEPIGRNNITWGRIVLHELAHLAGLGHNRNPGSLMYPDAAQQTIRPVGFSDGDRTGLRLLGREAGCLRSPPLPA